MKKFFREEIKVFFIVIAGFIITGNVMVEIFGETQCLAVAELAGKFVITPLVGLITIYFLWYFAWHIPKELFRRLRKSA